MNVRRTMAVGLAGLALAGGATGCAATEEAETSLKRAEKGLKKLERSFTNNKALNRKMAKVPLGASINSVKAKFGKPDNYQVSKSAGLGKQEYLYYGQWQLAFSNGKLESKNKY